MGLDTEESVIHELSETPGDTNAEAICRELSGTPILGTRRQN